VEIEESTNNKHTANVHSQVGMHGMEKMDEFRTVAYA